MGRSLGDKLKYGRTPVYICAGACVRVRHMYACVCVHWYVCACVCKYVYMYVYINVFAFLYDAVFRLH